jgi:16S rRNA (guanine527-N7)-methyltransferase
VAFGPQFAQQMATDEAGGAGQQDLGHACLRRHRKTQACPLRGEGGSAAFGDNARMPLPPDIAALRPELEAGLRALGLDPQAAVERAPSGEEDEARLAGALLAYLALLQRWNATYNLTAVREPREMLAKHLLDSLAMQPYARGLATLADLGTGPGLPGLPLALATPGLAVALVESNGKKTRFLRECVRQLGLAPRVRVLESRAEAVAEPGAFVAMKGQYPAGEIAELPAAWRVVGSHPLSVPGLAGERHLVEVARA